MSTLITVTRYHDISCGHRVVGHEGKCRGLHGHNYRIHFTCAAPEIDAVGRVIDFGVIKSQLCEWLEEQWDHKMLLWKQDPVAAILIGGILDRNMPISACADYIDAAGAIALTDFNPTAENMAAYLLHNVGPHQLFSTGVTLIRVQVDETRKCSAAAEID